MTPSQKATIIVPCARGVLTASCLAAHARKPLFAAPPPCAFLAFNLNLKGMGDFSARVFGICWPQKERRFASLAFPPRRGKKSACAPVKCRLRSKARAS